MQEKQAIHFAKITVRKEEEPKQVRISSPEKPQLSNSIIAKWQNLLDTASEIANVPSALIMRLNTDNIEVFLKSSNPENPYHQGEKADLVYGLYCETVIGTQRELLIPNARKDPVWKDNNPDIDINMIAYLGYPLNWPDGEVFGTICLLDNQENHFDRKLEYFLVQIKQHIESDMALTLSHKELENNKDKLEQLNAVKTRFLSLISHDIRGGVGTINQFLGLILANIEKYDKYKIKNILSSLHQNTRSTYHNLENLLNWSKSDLLNIPTDKKKIDLAAIVKELLNYFQQAVNIKQITLTSYFEKEKLYAWADENMITTALQNILSNAIKFTAEGGKIYVRLQYRQTGCLIEIEDSGRGMSKEELKSLFKYQKVKNKNDKNKGAGIGLLIAKEFLDKNNATIEVESEKDKGTIFRISLPKKTSASE